MLKENRKMLDFLYDSDYYFLEQWLKERGVEI